MRPQLDSWNFIFCGYVRDESYFDATSLYQRDVRFFRDISFIIHMRIYICHYNNYSPSRYYCRIIMIILYSYYYYYCHRHRLIIIIIINYHYYYL